MHMRCPLEECTLLAFLQIRMTMMALGIMMTLRTVLLLLMFLLLLMQLMVMLMGPQWRPQLVGSLTLCFFMGMVVDLLFLLLGVIRSGHQEEEEEESCCSNVKIVLVVSTSDVVVS